MLANELKRAVRSQNFLTLLLVQMFPFAVLIVPLYNILIALGLNGTSFGLVLGDGSVAHVYLEDPAQKPRALEGERVVPTRSPVESLPVLAEAASPAQALGTVDVVLPILHGPFGEDGTVQGLLELAAEQIPSGSVESEYDAEVWRMDRIRAKSLALTAYLIELHDAWLAGEPNGGTGIVCDGS